MGIFWFLLLVVVTYITAVFGFFYGERSKHLKIYESIRSDMYQIKYSLRGNTNDNDRLVKLLGIARGKIHILKKKNAQLWAENKKKEDEIDRLINLLERYNLTG